MILIKLKKWLLNAFFPPKCVGCGKTGGFVCEKCLKEIVFMERQECPTCRNMSNGGKMCSLQCAHGHFFDQLIVCSKYVKSSIVRKLIVSFKYKFSREICGILGEIMKTMFVYFSQNIFFMKNCIFVPVPIHKKRLKYRGFNQARLLADYLRESLNSDPLLDNYFKNIRVYDCLVRTEYHEAQAKLDRNERMKNLRKAFSINKKMVNKIAGKRVILIDDVATTGSTLNECSRILKKYGAKYVCGFVLSRGKKYC